MRAGGIFTADKAALKTPSQVQITNFAIFMTFLQENPDEKRLI
jgi:hypothetical protein